jgi:hypothetical protein
VILYLTSVVILDQENRRNTLICIEISTWYQSHGGHGVMEVRCGQNCISTGPVSSRVQTHSRETFIVFKNPKFPQPRQRQGADTLEISAGYNGAGCGKHKKFPQAIVEQGEENRTFPQVAHRQGEGKTGHFLRLHTGRVREKQEFPQVAHRQGEGKSGQFARYS